MSGIDFRGLVPSTNDPLSFLFTQLMKRVARNLIDQQVDLIDSDNEDIYTDGQDMETVIRYHSFSGGHKFRFAKDYFPPFEPDGVQVTCWLRGTNLGNELTDISGFNNNAVINGDPMLVDGTIDLGMNTHGVLSIALRMNRAGGEFENAEWLQVPDVANLRISTLSTGFSEFSRFRIFDLDGQGGKSRTIYEKIDDSTPNNGRMLQVQSDGSLLYVVKKGGVTTAKVTSAAVIAQNDTTDNPYDVFTSFENAGPTIHIYINGVDQTLSTFGGTVNWQDTLTNHDLFLFRRGLGTDGGFVNGDLYDYKTYMERVVSQAEVTRHQTNKWSISDIGFGHVMICDHWATYGGGGGEENIASFTSASFSSSSFHI